MPRPPKAIADAMRWLASEGGKARSRALTPTERRKAATKAVTARWRKTTKAERSAAASKASRARWAKKRTR